MPTSRAGRLRSRERGFTYLIVLVAVVVLGIVAEVAVALTSHEARAEREAELLFRGDAYRQAIRRYYEAGGVVKTYPRRLEDLLVDPRFPERHYLRMLYPDPLSRDGKGGWNLVHAPDGGIAGVVSRSDAEPLKKAHFPKGLEAFEGAQTYADWVFIYQPALTPLRRAPLP
jgi:type II secretory pathway pseudopilin PulG